MKKDSLPLQKGMFNESTNIQQPKGTWKFALNTLIGSWWGEGATVTNEHGNEVCYSLPAGDYTLIGAESLPDGNIVVFLTDDTTSIIGVHDVKNCTFETYIKSECLGFKKHRQINALTRIIAGCKRKVYFTDRVTSYKAVNLDELEPYLSDGFATPDDANADPANGWNCDKFDHFLSYLLGCIESASVNNSGGRILTGAHQFAIRYLDGDLNGTNWSPLTNPLYVYLEGKGGEPYIIDGEAPQVQGSETYSNKSITFTLTGLDTTFKYVQFAVAEAVSGTETIDNVYILNEVPLPDSGNLTYIYTGFNPNTDQAATLDEITIPSIPLEAVAAHAQIDNRLMLANVKTFIEDWASMQRATLLGKMKWGAYDQTERSDINPQDDTNASVNPDILFTDKTWMSDEVYAFGVVFVFENGQFSPTFHLPGRPANLEYTTSTDLLTLNQADHLYQASSTAAGQWDTELLTVVPDAEIYDRADRDGVIGESNVRHIPDSEFVNCPGPQETTSPAGQLDVNIQINGGVPSQIDITITNLNPGDEVLMRVISHNGTSNNQPGGDEILRFTFASPAQSFNGFVVGASDFYVFRYWASLNNGAYAYPENHRQIGYSSLPFVGQFELAETVNKHLGCQIPRWKIHNTAVQLDVAGTEGYMGYHQNDSCTYPQGVVDCNNVSVWDATSIGGEDLSGENIRHHRMPDISREIELTLANVNYQPSTSSDFFVLYSKEVTVRKLGIKVDLTDVYANLPADIESRIIGHYIVVANREDVDKTILDKGFMWRNQGRNTTGKITGGTDFWVEKPIDWQAAAVSSFYSNNWGSSEENYMEYISPRLVWRNEVLISDYIKFERYNTARNNSTVSPDEEAINVFDYHYAGGGSDYHSNNIVYHENFSMGNDPNFSDNPPPTRYLPVQGTHRKILAGNILPYFSVGVTDFTTGLPLDNSNGRQKGAFYQTDRAFPLPWKGNSPAINDFQEVAESSSTGIVDTQFENRGFCTSYVALKNYRDVYCSLGDLTYYPFHNCFIEKGASPSDIIKGGDTFIAQLRFVKARAERNGSNLLLDYQGGAALCWALVETSDINGSLAYAGRQSSQYAPKNFNFDYYLRFVVNGLGKSFNFEILNGNPENEDDIATYGEYTYDYNPDFGKHQTENPYFPLGNEYNYCDQCEGDEPNIIYYSEKGFSEDRNDAYKTILANNRIPIPSDSGVITNLFIEKDQLYTHTSKALWQVQTRPQQLQSNEATVFVGTGDIGAIPPVRLVSTEYGYAGSVDPFATITTQYGTFFVDSLMGRVFSFSKRGLNEISRAGMEKWFKEYGVVEFRQQFYELTGTDYPVKDTSSNNAVGYQSAYDSRMDRLILHKKDYKIADTTLTGQTINFGGLYYENPTDTQQPLPPSGDVNTLYVVINEDEYASWFYWEGSFIEVNLNDKNWFENKGWTLSFDLDQNVWISFHSYQPNFMYSDNNIFYSFINEAVDPRRVWAHNNYNYQTYYGTKYPHVIQVNMVNGANQEKVFYSTQYVSNAYLYDPTTDWEVEDESTTFDEFYVYNNSQICDRRDLIVKEVALYQDVTLPLNQSLVDRTDNYWRFNRFRDERVDYTLPIHTREWAELEQFYDSLGQGYLDKVPNPIAIDINKNIYNQARFRDKYLSLRLFFQPEQDYRIVTEILSFLNNNSTR
jgi:hypothetical protein